MMNVFGIMESINKVGKYFVVFVLVVSLFGVVSAQQNVIDAMERLCTIARSFLGIAAMLLVVLAGTTYAIGQMMGAETRARAAVWATAMLTGAVIGIIIYLVAPALIAILMGGAGAEPGADPCDYTGAGGGGLPEGDFGGPEIPRT
jgi:hypothetical protein